MHIPESIAADFSKVKNRNKENIKTGWGTDTQFTLGNIYDADSDKRCKSTKSLVPYNVQNNLRDVMKYSRNTSDALISNVNESVMQSHKSHTWTHKYFASVWQRFLTVFKECSKNWKMKFTLTQVD
ncbi:hypothetical protein ACS0PU_012659 [Formica fusca]